MEEMNKNCERKIKEKEEEQKEVKTKLREFENEHWILLLKNEFYKFKADKIIEQKQFLVKRSKEIQA